MILALLRKRPLLVAAFALACGVTLVFGVRTIRSALYWADPAHQNQPVEPWMTAGYVARSWHVPGPRLTELARLPAPQAKGHPQSLAEIARDRGVPVADVVGDVEKAIVILRFEQMVK